MGIHRVRVEQVVLHPADDAAEGGNVPAQHAVQIHATQLVRDAGRCAQYLEEQSVVARMLADFFVDQPQMARELANGGSAYAANLRMLRDDDEQLQQG